jgi:hypothetical protein
MPPFDATEAHAADSPSDGSVTTYRANDDHDDLYDPYDADRPLRLGCSCGQHASSAAHAAAELRSRW